MAVVDPPRRRTADIALTGGLLCLGLIWVGPLPDLARESFSAHMAMHIAVVAIAAPLVAFGAAARPWDPVRRVPVLFAPIPASIVELIVVWGWHAPVLHHAARHTIGVFVLEQATFLAAGLLLWLSAVGGAQESGSGLPSPSSWRRWAGVGALLFTSIHMTLLGGLFTFALRPLYVHDGGQIGWLTPMLDQQLGGAIMLLIGGASYLAGGLWLVAGGLSIPSPRTTEGHARLTYQVTDEGRSADRTQP